MSIDQSVQEVVQPLADAVNKLSGDIGQIETNVQGRIDALQATIDRVSADDAMDKAQIEQLKAELQAGVDGVDQAFASALQPITDSIKQMDEGLQGMLTPPADPGAGGDPGDGGTPAQARRR
jgi:methyl-accepting chemotaxis protein